MTTLPPRLRFVRPRLPPPSAWLPFLAPAYESQQFTNRGPVLRRFEQGLGRSLAPKGRRVSVVSSATAGITAMLQALGIRGLVACPSFTFAASGQAILAAGCEPWLCDVDPETWQLSPETLAPALAAGVAAILHVRALGLCHDLRAVEELAERAGVPLVVDAAACLGGRLPDGAVVGGQGTCEIFSLHATKPFGIGEGGAIFLAEGEQTPLERAANFGLEAFEICDRGVNAKMSEIQAAVGLAVLGEFSERQARRQAVLARYDAHASRHWGRILPGGTASGQNYPLLLSPALRNVELENFAIQRGIQLRSYYAPALHQSRAFAAYAGGRELPVSASLSGRMICLPVYPDLTDIEQQEVIDVVDDWLARAAEVVSSRAFLPVA